MSLHRFPSLSLSRSTNTGLALLRQLEQRHGPREPDEDERDHKDPNTDALGDEIVDALAEIRVGRSSVSLPDAILVSVDELSGDAAELCETGAPGADGDEGVLDAKVLHRLDGICVVVRESEEARYSGGDAPDAGEDKEDSEREGVHAVGRRDGMDGEKDREGKEDVSVGLE